MNKKEIEMNKFHEIELDNLFNWTQTLGNLRIQVGIFFATANLGILSVGVSQQKVIFFLFAALMFWAMIFIDVGIRYVLAHAYYRIAYLHKLYVKDDVSFSPQIYSHLASDAIKIASMKNNEEQVKALRGIALRRLNPQGFWLPMLASLLEIAIGLFLWVTLKWSLI